MGSIGHNDNLTAEGVAYHLQTATVPEKQKVRTTLFDMRSGKVVYSAEQMYDADVSDEDLAALVRAVHGRKLAESERIMALTRELASAPGAEAKHRLGMAYARNKMYDEAAQAFRTAIEERGDWSEPVLHLAVLHAARGRLDDAQDLLVIAERLSPGFADVRYHAGVVQVRSGRLREGLEHFDVALRLNPAFVAARLQRAMVTLRQERERNPGKASALAAVCARILPEIAEAVPAGSPYMNPQFTKACFLLQEARIEEAVVELSQAVAIGDAFAAAGATDSALPLVEVDAASPGRLPESELRAHILALEAQLDEHPTYADVRHALALARLYLAAALMERAELELETAIGINPAFTKARAYLRRIRDHVEGFRSFLRTLLK